MILDRVAFVSRLARNVPGTDKETFVAHSGFMFGGNRSAAISINIQPAGAELTAMAEGDMFKTYKAFTTASGVIETMRLTVSGTSETFIVRGRETYLYGSGQHVELTLVKDTTNGI